MDWKTNRQLRKELADMTQTAEFYKRRCDELQKHQSKMRDPERTIVCDVLANGCTLPPEHAGDRYKVPNSKGKPTAANEPNEG